jgi:hypothetical protein
MNPGLGLVGIFFLGIGGAILFEALFNLLKENGASSIGVPGYDILGFIGFFFIGFGLWSILQSGKPEMKENV